MVIDLWHSIERKGESAKKDIWAHHFTVFPHQSSWEGPLVSILLMKRVFVMILNKNSFISASQRVFFGHLVFKSTPKIVFTAAVSMVGNFQS